MIKHKYVFLYENEIKWADLCKEEIQWTLLLQGPYWGKEGQSN